MLRRPKKYNLTVYISFKTKNILDGLKIGKFEIINNLPESNKIVKDGFQFSPEIERMLELLQRDSKDQGHKKSKGWFIDQALESYVSKKDEIFFEQLKQNQTTKGKKKTKSFFVEEALLTKYEEFYNLAKS